MSQQCYIKCDNYYLFACAYLPETYNKVILLLQGYSHAMTDIDYFMTNVKNDLFNQNFAVVQFDPFGHGDSDGEIENFTYDILINNIKTVIKWIKKNISNDIIFITRGLFTLVTLDDQLGKLFNRAIALNPLYLTDQFFDEILDLLNIKNKIVDFNDWYYNIPENKKDMIESFFYTLGAKLKNLQGQYFNTETFRDFVFRMRNKNNIYNDKNYSILTNGLNECIIYNNSTGLEAYNEEYYYKYNALPRDPNWHFNVINKIVSLCSKENTGE